MWCTNSAAYPASRSRSHRRRNRHNCSYFGRLYRFVRRCGHKRRGRVAQGEKGQQARWRGEAHQPSQKLASHSRRRSRVSLTPLTVDACDEKRSHATRRGCCVSEVDEHACDEKKCSSTSSFNGSIQPLAVESMARWTSTRPKVLAVPRHGRTASPMGAAATVASKVPRSFGDSPPSESP